MNRVTWLAIGVMCSVLLGGVGSGCVRKTRVVTKPREDQALAGNRGYLLGTAPPSEQKTPSTRTYYETEVEIPTIEMHVQLPTWRREWVDKELYGNRGYLVGGPYQKQVVQPAPAQRPATPPKRSSLFRPRQEPVVTEEPVVETEAAYGTYTVKKGENLGEISMQVYGTSRAWKRIFEANRDILTDPNRIKPGQVLRIPRGKESQKTSQSGTIK